MNEYIPIIIEKDNGFIDWEDGWIDGGTHDYIPIIIGGTGQ